MVNSREGCRVDSLGKTMPLITVAMSTYNGEAYVSEQLDSVLGQTVDDFSVLVRDDGSSDGTVAILEEYERRGDIKLIRGNNVGVVRSFLDLLESVPPDAEFVSFCDQDDVWHPDKIERALEVLAPRNQAIPQLYCSEYTFCDASMVPQGKSHLNRRGVDFPKMLFENMVSGNTTVINRALVDRIVEAGSEGVYCHDWWLALVATSIGDLTFDDRSTLEYRRTGSNASPTGANPLQLLRYRVRTFFEQGQLVNITNQLRRLYELYANEMPTEKRRLLERVLFEGRLSKALIPLRFRQKTIEELALRVLFLMGCL